MTGPAASDMRILALSAVDDARRWLARYAAITDTPAEGVPESADLLDAARVMLAQGERP